MNDSGFEMEFSCCRCRTPAVYHQEYSGRYLCSFHLKEDVIARLRRTVRKQGGLGRKKVIGVVGGGFIQFLLYCIVDLLKGRQGMSLLYIETAENRSEISSFVSILPSTISLKIVQTTQDLLEDTIKEAGGDRIFSDRYLEEEAAQVIRNLLSGDCSSLINRRLSQEIRYLAPLLEIPAKEIYLAGRFSGLDMEEISTHSDDAVYNLLLKLEDKHPSVPFSLISYLNRIQESG